MPEITDEVLARYQAIETAAEAVDESAGTREWAALVEALKPIDAPPLVSSLELRAASGATGEKVARRIGTLYWRKGAAELDTRSMPVAATILRELADVEAKR